MVTNQHWLRMDFGILVSGGRDLAAANGASTAIKNGLQMAPE
jgi:hypothetical protein